MRITIEPETDEEREKFEEKVFENVYELIVAGSFMQGGILPKPFSHSQGDLYVLMGKIEEVKERLRAHDYHS